MSFKITETTLKKGKEDNLNRSHVPLQIIERSPRSNLGTSVWTQYAAPDGAPVMGILDSALQPWRILLQLVLLINPTGNFHAAALAGDDEAKYG